MHGVCARKIDGARASLDSNNNGLYEPSHASAPDIAGRGIANPLATIPPAAMILRYPPRQAQAADRIASAALQVLASGYRMPDIGSAGTQKVGPREMGGAVAVALTTKTTITKS